MESLSTKARRAANLEAYRQQLAEMERSFGAMLRQLPNKTEVPNLLVDISQTGLAAGLEEKLFQPQGENKKDFYAELPIKIRLTGGYHEMGTFASGIAALPRIVTLHDIEIVPSGGRGVTDPTELTFNVTAKTYRYLDDEEQAAAAEPQAKGKKKDRKGKKKPAEGEA
jgi:type IV pilus assembly protein PilO